MSDYIPALSLSVPLPEYARISSIMLIDPAIGSRHLLVFAVLAAHATYSGHVSITQARIAEMLGYFRKGKPDNSLVSSLISNPGWRKQKSGVGPGLEQLGYVVRNGQTGFNQVSTYQLAVPCVEDDCVVRPNGDKTLLRVPAYRQEDQPVYRARKKAEERSSAVAMVARETFTDTDGSMYLREDVLADIEQTKAGHSSEVPEAAYHHFAMIEKPRTRAKAVVPAPTPAPALAVAPVASKPVYDSRKFDNADAPGLSDFDAEKRSGYTRAEVLADDVYFHDGLEREIPASVYRQHGVPRSLIRRGL